MIRYQVFLSSTFTDLKEERKEVLLELSPPRYITVGMEHFGASSRPPWEVIEKTIEESDYYVLIIGGRYGSLVPGMNISYTEREFLFAKERGIPILAFILPDPEKKVVGVRLEQTPKGKARLKAFVDKVKNSGITVEFWNDSNDLVRKISKSMANEVVTNPQRGWTRGLEIGASNNVTLLAQVAPERSRSFMGSAEPEPEINLKSSEPFSVIAHYAEHFFSPERLDLNVPFQDLFYPAAVTMATSSKGSESVGKAIVEELEKQNKFSGLRKGMFDPTINADSGALNDFLLHLRSLNLIHQQGSIWKLTSKGEQVRSRIQTARRKMAADLNRLKALASD